MSNFQLKIIALITMTLDHIGFILVDPNVNEGLYLCLRYVGRISFVLFAFLIVEGFIYTKDRKKHLFILFMFALLCQLPVLIGVDMALLNIYFTLSIGVLALNILSSFVINDIIKVVSVFLLILVASKFDFDYGGFGVSLIIIFYVIRVFEFSRLKSSLIFIAGYVLLSSYFKMGEIQMFGVVTVILIYFYSNNLGIRLNKFKYVFYVYYPLHLVILEGINFLLK